MAAEPATPSPLTRPARTRIKVCGFTRVEDALAAVEAGIDAIGLVFYPPSPRHVTPEQAADIVRALPAFVTSVALFVDAEPDVVRATCDVVGFDLAQYHGDETPQQCTAAGIPFIKALRVRPGLDLLHCDDRFCEARGLLLDAFQAGAPGGTGHRFDWSLIPDGLTLPLILSGGLGPDNVGEAVRRVRPYAVDVSSGVEREKGIKCADLVRQFVKGVRNEDV
ncbi:MAG: phosphoribosylanthranilate isomerase [Betaproteobacteria bacterium]|nr:phosphoribosylanthranilate isomerase [Betaproteobacteria bacterium]